MTVDVKLLCPLHEVDTTFVTNALAQYCMYRLHVVSSTLKVNLTFFVKRFVVKLLFN